MFFSSACLGQIQSKDKPIAVLRPSSFSQSSASTSDTESYVKQLIDRHRLSKCSSTSSVFSRRDSTSSTKVAVITPSVANDSCCSDKDASAGTQKMKNPNSKNKKIDKKNSKKGNGNTGHISAKLRKKEKETSSLNCVSGCILSWHPKVERVVLLFIYIIINGLYTVYILTINILLHGSLLTYLT